jgi:protocatechuate 3,4-dioxygenase alpha subunit
VSRRSLTPSQTVGPYLSLGLRWADGADVVPPGTPGAFWLRGVVRDGAGAVVTDALVETWQADVDGVFCHPADPRWTGSPATPGFRGFGRSETVTGEYAIHTVRPGGFDGGAPHVLVSVFARGLLDRVVTRVYLPADDARADPLLAALPPAAAATLLARETEDGFRFDIHLQGPDETVFLAV